MALLKTRDIDMTKGSPVRLMFRFATPTLIGSIFQTLYSMADSAILGRYAGSRALAAVGATAQATGFILLFAMAVTSAFSIFISQKVGAKDSEGVRRCFASAMSLTAVLGVVLGCVGIVTARPLMRLLGAPADIIDDSVLYIRIICGGCMAQFFYNAATNTLRSIGNSMTPLVILIFSSILNVILDVIAVVVLHMGVAGVASATVISQALSAVLCMVYIFRRYKDIIPKEGGMGPAKGIDSRYPEDGAPVRPAELFSDDRYDVYRPDRQFLRQHDRCRVHDRPERTASDDDGTVRIHQPVLGICRPESGGEAV